MRNERDPWADGVTIGFNEYLEWTNHAVHHDDYDDPNCRYCRDRKKAREMTMVQYIDAGLKEWQDAEGLREDEGRVQA